MLRVLVECCSASMSVCLVASATASEVTSLKVPPKLHFFDDSISNSFCENSNLPSIDCSDSDHVCANVLCSVCL